MKRIEVPILIVGGGPVGLMTGILLAREGLQALVIERRDRTQPAPAASEINSRTLEIMRQAGLDMKRIYDRASAPEDTGQVRFVSSLSGDELGVLPFGLHGDESLRITPTPVCYLPQNRFEPILVDELRACTVAGLRFGVTWESAAQDADGVVSIVRAADGEPLEVHSQYLIGADGAGSRVRKWLGLEMEGPQSILHFMMIHFGANLRQMVKDRPAVLYWLLDPEGGRVLVAHDIDSEWVYMHRFEPSREQEEDYSVARCQELVCKALGRPEQVEILNRNVWSMSCQVAKQMRSGRAFLVGDAAHRFPPTGGLGLNTGIQDARNLAWKLAAVVDGWADDALLDTYANERRPVARKNGDESLVNASNMFLIDEALGVLEDPRTERMQATLADPEGRKRVEAAIAKQQRHFNLIGLQLGHTYGDGAAVVPDGSEAPVLADPVCEFVPSSRPGAYLPHAWVSADDGRVSTLDLVAVRGLTLISQGRHSDWAKTLEGLGNLPITHVRVGVDFHDSENHWSEVCGLEEAGALLVRPDNYVAWRARRYPEHPLADLREAIPALKLRPS